MLQIPDSNEVYMHDSSALHYEVPPKFTSNSQEVKSRKKPLDSALALCLLFKSLVGGKGLSEKDISAILKLIHDPDFDVSSVPFFTGRACNKWLKKKLEEENGPLEVRIIFLPCCVLFPETPYCFF